jgi:carbamoyl-phosphate synthase large subunit
MALALDVGGLMNVQYALKDGDDLRARGQSARLAHRALRRQGDRDSRSPRSQRGSWPARSLASFGLKQEKLGHVGVKEAVFPFARFPGVDVLLGPEMRSTGEVMGLDRSFDVAFAKSQLGAGSKVPVKGTVFVSVRDEDKPRILPIRSRSSPSSASRSSRPAATSAICEDNGIPASKINKVLEGRPHIVDAIKNGEIQLVFNTTDGPQALADSRSLRRAALLHKVPYYTTLAGAIAAAEGIKAYCSGDLEVRSLQSYFARAA